MKKLFALFILSLYLISTTELREIVKLPVLFQHYYEHKEIDNAISFSAYLADHYNSIPHTDNDEERDNQLPFKTLDLSGLSMPAIPVSFNNHLQKAVRILVVKNQSLYLENFIPGPVDGKVWQPPKA